jgi:hypothetical protein
LPFPPFCASAGEAERTAASANVRGRENFVIVFIWLAPMFGVVRPNLRVPQRAMQMPNDEMAKA